MGLLAELDLAIKPHAKAASRTEAALTTPQLRAQGGGITAKEL